MPTNRDARRARFDEFMRTSQTPKATTPFTIPQPPPDEPGVLETWAPTVVRGAGALIGTTPGIGAAGMGGAELVAQLLEGRMDKSEILTAAALGAAGGGLAGTVLKNIAKPTTAAVRAAPWAAAQPVISSLGETGELPEFEDVATSTAIGTGSAWGLAKLLGKLQGAGKATYGGPSAVIDPTTQPGGQTSVGGVITKQAGKRIPGELPNMTTIGGKAAGTRPPQPIKPSGAAFGLGPDDAGQLTLPGLPPQPPPIPAEDTLGVLQRFLSDPSDPNRMASGVDPYAMVPRVERGIAAEAKEADKALGGFITDERHAARAQDQGNKLVADEWLADQRDIEAMQKLADEETAAAEIARRREGLEPSEPSVSETISAKIPGGRESSTIRWRQPAEEGAEEAITGRPSGPLSEGGPSVTGGGAPVPTGPAGGGATEDPNDLFTAMRGLLAKSGKAVPAAVGSKEGALLDTTNGTKALEALEAQLGREIPPPVGGRGTIPVDKAEPTVEQMFGEGTLTPLPKPTGKPITPIVDTTEPPVEELFGETLAKAAGRTIPRRVPKSEQWQPDKFPLEVEASVTPEGIIPPNVPTLTDNPQPLNVMFNAGGHLADRVDVSGENYRNLQEMLKTGQLDDVPTDLGFVDDLEYKNPARLAGKALRNEAKAAGLPTGKEVGAVPTTQPTVTQPSDPGVSMPIAEQLKRILSLKGKPGGGGRMGPDKGFANLGDPLLVSAGLGLGGAAIGGAVSAANDENPLLGAAAGAVIGGSIPSIIRLASKAIGRIGADPNVPEEVKHLVGQASTGDAEQVQSSFFQLIPQYVRTNLLIGPNLPNNIFAGPYGSGMAAGMELHMAGDPRGTAILNDMSPTNWWALYYSKIPEARELIRTAAFHEAERFGGPAPEFAPLQFPAIGMLTGDLTTREILMRHGLSEDLARSYTHTSEPVTPLMKGVANWPRTTGWFGETMMPFSKTLANVAEQGAARTPILGKFLQGKYPELAHPEAVQNVQQVMGSAVPLAAGAAGYALPDVSDDPNLAMGERTLRSFISNIAGPYSLLANVGYGTGKALGNPATKGVGSALNAGVTSAAGAVPLPTFDIPMSHWGAVKALLDGELPDQLPAGIVPGQSFFRTYMESQEAGAKPRRPRNNRNSENR